MQIITKQLPMTHRLYLISDIHEGSVLVHRNGLDQVCEAVGSERNSYLAVLGDLCEGIVVDDKRYEHGMTDAGLPVPLLQYKALVRQFRPIKSKILTILEGNHDFKISNRFGNGVRDLLCDELGVEYGTYSCKLAVNDKGGRLMYKAFLTHGAGSIRSSSPDPIRREANMLFQLRNRLYRKAGDTALMACGHVHKLLIARPKADLYLTDDGRHVKQAYVEATQVAPFIHPDLRHYVCTGSFMKLYAMGVSGYAERFGYDPVELGYIVVDVEDGIIRDVQKVILD